MRQKDTGTPKKKTRRAAGQMVASAVMALAIAVGGFGTTALLASQPAGLTVEPSALLWEGDGFLLLYKRLDNGCFQWPRNGAERQGKTQKEGASNGRKITG